MISVLHPSRSRVDKSVDTISKWRCHASGKFQLIVSIDKDDDYVSYSQAHNLPVYSYNFPGQDRLLIRENKSAVDAINNAASIAEGSILIVVSDDTDCPMHWDKLIIEALEGKSGVLKTFDGVQKWICTMPIMTRDYYEEEGYIYHPSMAHMFVDTYLTHKADLKGKLIIRNDIVFTHNHYSTGKTVKDAVNIKADSTWDEGQRFYLKACRSKFGLGNIDIFKLSKEAHQAGHVAWLKKKGIR